MAVREAMSQMLGDVMRALCEWSLRSRVDGAAREALTATVLLCRLRALPAPTVERLLRTYDPHRRVALQKTVSMWTADFLAISPNQ